MLPRGAAALIALRQSGYKPACPVWVNYGDFHEPDWERWTHTQYAPELVVRLDDPVDRLDFRCLVWLRVTLFMSRYDDKAARLYAHLQDYAAEIDVLSPDFDLDVGWHWSAQTGQRDFNTAKKEVA
jgi:hypothetical protein